MRKDRYWACPCCERRWRRTLTGLNSHPVRCRTCGEDCYRSTTYQHSVDCKHVRVATKVLDYHERLGSHPRRQSGARLAPTREVFHLWADCRKASTRPALERRATKWLQELQAMANDARIGSTLDAAGITKTREGHVYKRGGQMTYPTIKLRFVLTLPGAHGIWKKHLLNGVYDIEIADGFAPDGKRRGLNELRDTIVHEALHMLDDMSGQADAGHDRLWDKRLARMKELFPGAQYGTKEVRQ
jgi:hypothetical protein